MTGAAEYVDDIPSLPGMLHAALVMSTKPHAFLKSVNTQPALDLNQGGAAAASSKGFGAGSGGFGLDGGEVVAVLLAEDVQGTNHIGAVVKDEEVTCAYMYKFKYKYYKCSAVSSEGVVALVLFFSSRPFFSSIFSIFSFFCKSTRTNFPGSIWIGVCVGGWLGSEQGPHQSHHHLCRADYWSVRGDNPEGGAGGGAGSGGGVRRGGVI